MSANSFKINFDNNLTNDDIFLVGDSEIDEKGLVHHHISSANDLYDIGIPQIIKQVFKLKFVVKDIKRSTIEEENIEHVIVKVTFSDVFINKPTMINYNSGKEEILYPIKALRNDRTYKSNLTVSVHIETTAVLKNGSDITNKATVKNFTLCRIPIMIGSKWCNTYKLSKEALMNLHEDPSDTGGYFIIDGNEWVIDCVENILFNKVRIFKNEGYGKEIMRAEFISKPGDFYLNSDQFIVRWLNDGQITIEIRREKLKDIYIPFYLIYRLMGWNTDKQIFDNILFGDYESPLSKNIDTFLLKAFNVKYNDLSDSRYIYNQNEVLHYFAENIKDTSFHYLDVQENPENYKKIYHFLLEHMDIHFLQHMGTDKESRNKKLRFLSLVIRKMFLVKLNNMEPTDRDSYNSKRIHAAGTSYAKSFKTYFNASIIQQMKRKIVKDLKSISYFQIDLAGSIRSSVHGADFEKSITQAITAGNRSEITVGKRVRINRLSSQLLNRKNQLNVLSILRQVTATSTESAKQSERASEMRRVHLSFLGYICVAHSPEGEKVGINKQLALFSFVTKATISADIKDILLSDDEIYHIDTVDYEDIGFRNLSNVFINGDWIGCCENALYIAEKYRKRRRKFEISPEISIVWDNTQDEVYFWTDVGRVIRPLLIVYNNIQNPELFPKGKEFMQGIKLTKKHIDDLYAKRISSQDLLKENIIEYISAEEQENMLLAPSYEYLKDNQNNKTMQYTHCDIPQAQLGLTALTSPYANHNQVTRLQYQTSQCKQTCGRPAMNWPYRADKDTFLQYNCETPIVKTISSRYLYPNGSNCIVAIMTNGGYNQEDSVIINKGSIERGLFNGCKLTFKKVELDQREEFANPDITNTIDIKDACYDKLTNGIIKVGSIVNKGDVIIGKIIKLPRNSDDNYQYADRSIVYKENEPAIVHDVILDRNEKDERFCKVILRKVRPVDIGDKFSNRSGQKGVCGVLLREEDMPFTESGMKPSIIFNPLGIPKRMTIGQLYESLVGNWCAEKATMTDATIFRKVDIESIATELEDLGLNRYGYHRLYNGVTGEVIDTEIFMGPVYYQRLQKFTVDTQYAFSRGPSDAITNQPLDGKSSGGGLRIGEMERDVLCSHGVSRFLSEKFFNHSDGYTEYVCRCGKAAVVNIKRGIYKCVYCRDNADIVAYPTSWSSKLFMQEMETMNVGIRRKPDRFITNIDRTKIFEKMEQIRNS